MTPAGRSGAQREGAYVVCLDCGKQFSYDTTQMRIGKPIPRSHPGGVLEPEPYPRRGKGLKYAVWASVPLALIAGIATMRGGGKAAGKPQSKGVPEKKPVGAPKS